MIPVVFVAGVMYVSAILGAEKWRSKTTKYVIVAVLAFLQTAFVLLYMFIMKKPDLPLP